MGTVLQFAEQLSEGPGWTAAERAQLRDVGLQMAGVEVVFGTSELGDPWCVVTDEEGEVLLHAARIGGEFVVHSTTDDAVIEGSDLWGTAKRLLGDMLKDRRGLVLPFPPEALGQTAVLVFMVAAVLRGDLGHWGGAIDTPAPAEPETRTAAPEDHDAATVHDDAPARGEAPPADDRQPAAVKETAQAAPAAAATGPGPHPPPPPEHAETAPASAAASPKTPAPAPPDRPAPAPTSGQGQATEAAFTASGGGAAPGTERTALVHGGDGDDRIAVGSGEVATGGKGGDTFVLTPTASGGPAAAALAGPTLLGVIGDFHAAEGDRIELAGKGVVVVDRAEADVLAAMRGQMPDAPVIAGRHIGYDLDGDGREDVYVLVTASDWHGVGAASGAIGAHDPAEPIGIVGSPPSAEPALPL